MLTNRWKACSALILLFAIAGCDVSPPPAPKGPPPANPYVTPKHNMSAGWAGQVQNMAQEAMVQEQQEANARLRRLVVAVGGSVDGIKEPPPYHTTEGFVDPGQAESQAAMVQQLQLTNKLKKRLIAALGGNADDIAENPPYFNPGGFAAACQCAAQVAIVKEMELGNKLDERLFSTPGFAKLAVGGKK